MFTRYAYGFSMTRATAPSHPCVRGLEGKLQGIQARNPDWSPAPPG